MIDGQFIQVKTKDNFVTALENEEINDSSIAFIEDTNEIWAKGKYYKTVPDGGTDGQVLSTDGTLLKWDTVEGSSVDLSGYAKLSTQESIQFTLSKPGDNEVSFNIVPNGKMFKYDSLGHLQINTEQITTSSIYGSPITYQAGLLTLSGSTGLKLTCSTNIILEGSNVYLDSQQEENKILKKSDLNNYVSLNSANSVGSNFTLTYSSEDISNNITMLGTSNAIVLNSTNGVYLGCNHSNIRLFPTGINIYTVSDGNINLSTNTGKVLYNNKEVATVDDIAAGSGIDLSDYVKQTQIVQSTGSSTSNIMSQKAVTDALSGKASTAVATTTSNGLMSKEDKAALNSLTASSSPMLNLDLGVLTSKSIENIASGSTPQEAATLIMKRLLYPTHYATLSSYQEPDLEYLTNYWNEMKNDGVSDKTIYSDVTKFTLIADYAHDTTSNVTSFHETFLNLLTPIICDQVGDATYNFKVPSITFTIKRFFACPIQLLQDGIYSQKNGWLAFGVDNSTYKAFMAEITIDAPEYLTTTDSAELAGSDIMHDMSVVQPSTANLPRKLLCVAKLVDSNNEDFSQGIKYCTIAESVQRSWGLYE